MGRRATLIAEAARAGSSRLLHAGLRWWVQRERVAVDVSALRERGGREARSGFVFGLAAGNFGFTATRLRAVLPLFVANKGEIYDWAQLGVPEVPNDACLQLIELCSTTTTGTVRGGGKIAHG